MKFLNKSIVAMFIVFALFLSGCGDQFLDKLNNDALVVPETLDDMEALLQNTNVMNGGSAASGSPLPVFGEASTDDFYLSDDYYAGSSQTLRDLYTWEKKYVYDESVLRNWSLPYKSVLYANLVLDNLKKIGRDMSNAAQWDRLRGAALFFRSNAYYHLAQVFAVPYAGDAAQQQGLPIRLEADISATPEIPNLEMFYDKMLTDLQESLLLLPELSSYKTNPTQAAAHALLAKIYLVMHNFPDARAHAEKALGFNESLLDYNALDKKKEFPIPKMNAEIIFYANMNITAIQNVGFVGEGLLSLYESKDLRKELFFNATGGFRGSYSGESVLFCGFTTSELYLIVAECLARSGKGTLALTYLDKLRENRFTTGSFKKLVYTTDEAAIKAVLKERRCELVLRGSTWSDLRRLNQYEESKRTMRRVINGEQFILAPNDPKYTLLIPMETIRFLNIKQNER